MNDVIRDLYNRSLDAAVPETWTALTPAQLERFAAEFANRILWSVKDVFDNDQE